MHTTLGSAIKKAREQCEMSQQQIAIALEFRMQRFHGLHDYKISQQTISVWEKRGCISAMELLEFCQITGKSLCISGTIVTPKNKINSKILWLIALSYWMYLASLDEFSTEY